MSQVSSTSSAPDASGRLVRRARTWPVFVLSILLAAALYVTVRPQVDDFIRFMLLLATPLAGLVVFLAWLFGLSRLRAGERVAVVVMIPVLAVGFGLASHESMRFGIWAYGMPAIFFAIAIGLLIAGKARPGKRMAIVLLVSIISWSPFLFGRWLGTDGSYVPNFIWRWQLTAEEELLAEGLAAETIDVDPATWSGNVSSDDWARFRGPRADSRVRNRLAYADWQGTAPREIWRNRIGPGLGSFSHVDGRLFTMEQRGEEELVICYDAKSGKEIWHHSEMSRFEEQVAGPGPRCTPTYADGKVYSLGGKAILTCIDAATGKLLWRRDLMREIDAALPMWGFAASPLVVDGLVIVHADGSDGRGWIACDAATGKTVWHLRGCGNNYTSAQPAAVDGVPFIMLMNDEGVMGVNAKTGEVLWQFRPTRWQGKNLARTQPQQIGPNAIIVPTGNNVGIARLSVKLIDDKWQVEEKWFSRRMRMAFNDFVFHGGYLYGFDKDRFVCIDAITGDVAWRTDRASSYEFGQVLLLENAGLLVVTTENSGEVVLVEAASDQHRERGRLQAFDAKCWNHPIVVGDKLFVRNGKEAVCYELPVTRMAEGG